MTDFSSAPLPTPPPPPPKSNTGLIIAIVAVVLICCCIGAVGLFLAFGEDILYELGLSWFAPLLAILL